MPRTHARERLSCLLVVDDDESELQKISSTLAAEGFEVTGCHTPQAALDLIRADGFGAVVVCLESPVVGGAQTLNAIPELKKHAAVIISLRGGSCDSAGQPPAHGVLGDVPRAGSSSELIGLVHAATQEQLEQYARNLENAVEENVRDLRAAKEALMNEITERRRVQAEHERLAERVRQSRKVEALGPLTGGLAHDFNNLLTTILGNTEILIASIGEQADDPSKKLIRDGLAQIYSAGERAAALSKQLAAFSQDQGLGREVIDPAEVIADLQDMLQRLAGERIEIALKLESESQRVRAHPSQIEHVISNLVVNAAEAMDAGGALTISVGAEVVEEEGDPRQPELPAGEMVTIRVADQGKGMGPDVLKHVFEPFFSTKIAEEGAGLGLATAYGTVRHLGGNMSVESEPGKGTVFTVYLPVESRIA